MILIGLTGPAGCGKDTVGQILCDRAGFTRIAFADPIKRMVRQLGIETDNRDTKEQPIDWLGRSPRYLMQTLGTEWGRNMVHPELWLMLAEREIKHNGGHTVITDVRFDNEADLIHKNGGVVWKISRRQVNAVERHASESGVNAENIDRYIVNNGTIADLTDEVLLTLTNDWALA